MKKILSALVITWFCCSPIWAGTTGDINGDNKVGLEEATYALKVTAGLVPDSVTGYSVPVSKTGQTKCFNSTGTEIACENTGQDGEFQKGIDLPGPRFTDNGDGTVTDNKTGLIWLRMHSNGTWEEAIEYCNGLADGMAGLSDGSSPGDWRLPNLFEMESLVNMNYSLPSLSNTQGTGQHVSGDPFLSSVTSNYWTSTRNINTFENPFYVSMSGGGSYMNWPANRYGVWPVRDARNQNRLKETVYALQVVAGLTNEPPPQNSTPVGKTGQTICYDSSGNDIIPCAGTGHDGDLQKGVADPAPRFTDNGNGTVTDNKTGLIWVKKTFASSEITWSEALIYCNELKDGVAGLSDGSSEGDWRLPNMSEIGSLRNMGYQRPSISNTAGTGQHVSGDPFNMSGTSDYWTSTTGIFSPKYAFAIYIGSGYITHYTKDRRFYAWAVRGAD